MTLGVASTNNVSPLALDERARIHHAVARSAIFRDLPPPAIDDIASRVTMRRALGGQAVLSQDEAGDALYLLMAGRVKIVMFGDSGGEVTLAVLRPGDIFGEMSLFDGHARSANVVALEPATALALARQPLLEHLRAYPQTAFHLLSELSRRLRRADETIAEMALCDVEDRLIRRLVQLAKEDGGELPEGLIIRRRPKQQDLANMVGSCRETISRTFNQLVRKGLIVPRGRSLVVTRRLISTLESPAKAA
ncbi:MAG: Crp/Fnr family transcriptional regulator [Deltaproteobacteria bacterium]|nr:Crp/Fnr family transcriptional regulator [Deltaproteobacteria bacterium]